MNRADFILREIDKYFKIAILFAFLILLILIRFYRLDSCDLCKIEINNTIVNQNEFMSYYWDKCMSIYRINLTSPYNISKVRLIDINYTT